MSVYLKGVIPDDAFVDYNSRRNRISDVISTKLSKSSFPDENNMNCFRFSRMYQPCARQMKKIIFQQIQLTEMITLYHFNGRSEAYNRYITKAMEYLNIFRAIFECHILHNPQSIKEVSQFQPLFQCFLRQLMTTLDEIANTTESSSSSSSSTSSLIKSQKINVEKANCDLLYFKAEVFTDSNERNMEQIEIRGCTDLIVSVGAHNALTWDSVSFIIELKPPPTFSVNGDFEAEKNQVFAQLLGLKTKFDETNLNSKIPKACLTDGFGMYICFLYNNVYYISGHTLKAEDYINALLFQLCDINAEELNKLIDTSEECIEWAPDDEEKIDNNLTEEPNDDSTTTHNTNDNCINDNDRSPKRSKRVINFKYEDELNEYQTELAYLTRLENRIWGFTHMDEESLQNCVPNIGPNPSDYVMSKFLNDT